MRRIKRQKEFQNSFIPLDIKRQKDFQNSFIPLED